MFDSKAEIGLTIRVKDSDAPKKLVVKFPTDEQIITWRRKKKVTQKDLGRDKFQIQRSKPEDCDLALANAIRVDKDGPEITKAEAVYILNRLTHCEVPTRPDRDGQAFTIEMKVMRRFAVSHKMRLPSVEEQMDYDAMRSSITFAKYGQQEIRINFQAAAELYDKLKLEVNGYVNDIPVSHKAEVVNVLLQEIQAEDEDSYEDEDDDDQD